MGKKKSTKSTKLLSKRNLKKTTKIGIIVFIIIAIIGIILGVVFGVIIPNQKTSEEIYWNSISEKREIANLDLEIPDYITNIPNNAFRDFTSLTSVTIPTSVTHIGDDAFPDKTIVNRHFQVPAGTITITDNSWAGWGVEKETLKQVIIPSSVTSIGDSAFAGFGSLASISIPTSVTSIGDRAFSKCTSLRTLTIDNIDNITHIGAYAFSRSGLGTVIIRDKSGKEEIHNNCESFDPQIIDAKIFTNSISSFCEGGMS